MAPACQELAPGAELETLTVNGSSRLVFSTGGAGVRPPRAYFNLDWSLKRAGGFKVKDANGVSPMCMGVRLKLMPTRRTSSPWTRRGALRATSPSCRTISLPILRRTTERRLRPAFGHGHQHLYRQQCCSNGPCAGKRLIHKVSCRGAFALMRLLQRKGTNARPAPIAFRQVLPAAMPNTVAPPAMTMVIGPPIAPMAAAASKGPAPTDSRLNR
jgi:hypothetical protein